ncbi:MAG: oligosaccharide flippase family protein [Treponema sp.]|nr:oligosaccharide flippase family protein [Treponema sp.]
MEKNKNSTPSVKKNYLLSTLYEILCIITPFITAPYLARVLGADQIGVNSLVCSHQAYFLMFATLGTSAYGSREIARNRDNIFDRSKIFWEIELLSIFTSVISLVFWVFFILLRTQYRLYYIILTIGIINRMLEINWFYAGMEQFKYTVTRNAIVKITGIILIFLFVHQKEDLYLFILINAACTFLGTLSMWIPLKKFLVKVPAKELKIFPHFKETLIYFIPTIATSIYQVLDKTLIGAITHEESQNGYYEQANKIITIIKVLTFGSLNTVMGSRISYLYAKEKFDEIKDKINKSIDFVMFIGIGCCFGLYGVAKHFVPFFFGPGYDEVIPLIYILSPIVLIIGISNCLGSLYYTPVGKRMQSAIYLIIGALLNLIANIILIPNFKSQGAAIGSIIAEFIITILYFSNCKGFYTLKLFFLSIYKKILAGLIMFLYLFLINKYVIISNPLILLIQISGGSIIYILILFILKDSILLNCKNIIIQKFSKSR